MSEGLVKGMIKGLWNKHGKIKMLFQKLKKEGTSSINMSLQSEKGLQVKSGGVKQP